MSAKSGRSIDGVQLLREKRRRAENAKVLEETGQTKAQHYWKLLRNSVTSTVEAVVKSDSKEVVVSHGIHHIRKINHRLPLKQVIYNKHKKEYLSLDTKFIRIFESDGRKKDVVDIEEDFNRLCFAANIKQYVGWTHQGRHLVVMGDDFEVLSVNKADTNVFSVKYNANTNEIITGGLGCLTAWVFRYGNRHLLPRQTAIATNFENEQFNIITLEETASKTQQAYVACSNGVMVFNVYKGQFIMYKKDMHARQITAIMFFNPLKYLVTGARDGSIKVWDNMWHLQLVFIGHNEQISSLGVYPYGPLLMSASYDCSLRVWSLETCDQVDSIETEEPIEDLGSTFQENNFFSFCRDFIDLWKAEHLHQIHTSVGFRVDDIKHTDHPNYPVRSVLLCKDASVRLVTPPSGEVLTTLLMNPKRHLVDAAYAVADDLLFAVYENGDIIKCRTDTNPCTILDEWKCRDIQKACNYIMVYEYVVDSAFLKDDWKSMFRAITAMNVKAAQDKPQESSDRTLLLGGRKDGFICVFRWDTGEVSFEIEAHGSKGVLNMIANSAQDQLISAGNDNIIKVWRLYPYAEEALAPLMSFYCAQTPLHMCVMKGKLSVAFQDHTTATYSVVVYNLTSKRRHDHPPDDDHTDSIAGITCCPRMKLFASCSTDGSVRIWNDENKLMRLLQLNAVPTSIGFCNQKGDLLIGVGHHLHKIEHSAYMPKAKRFKMVSMKFSEVTAEQPIELDERKIRTWPKDDVKRLKAAHSSFKFAHYVDSLTEDEADEILKEKEYKEKMYAVLDAREDELLKIRDGKILAKKPRINRKIVKREAFQKYMDIFYDRPKIQLPKDNPYEMDTALEMAEGKSEASERPDEGEYIEDKEPSGFFPPPKEAEKRSSAPGEPLQPMYPIMPGGFIPNSVLVHLLWPKYEPPAPVVIEDTYKPPELTVEQLAQLNKTKKKRWREHVKEVTGVQQVKTLKQDVVAVGESLSANLKFLEDDDDDERADTPPSKLMERMKEVMQRPPTPKTPEPEPEPEPATPKTKTKVIKPSKPMVKHVSRPPPPTPPMKKPPTPPPPHKSVTPPPPPPPAPLPDFILQFQNFEWFQNFFPDADHETFPKPWTIPSFVTMLLRLLKIADYKYKKGIVDAIRMLNLQETLPNAIQIIQTLLNVLNPSKSPPSCLDGDQKEFIRAGLMMMQSFGIYDKNYVMELMVQFLDGDREIRGLVIEIFTALGLQDPHHYYSRELDAWDVWSIEGDDRKLQLKSRCKLWLDRWMMAFKVYLEATIEKMKRGVSVHGRMNTPKTPSTPKSILRKLEAEDDGRKGPRSVTVTFDAPLDRSVVDNATYIEAINYFCDMEMEKELAKLQRAESVEKVVEAKNTVLVLPKITSKPCLVRLGDTHTSRCHARRETNLSIDYSIPQVTARGHQPPPGTLHGFAPSINLPMKTLYMNPFPSSIDKYDPWNQQPILLTLKSSQKYFVPQQSYVNEFEQFPQY